MVWKFAAARVILLGTGPHRAWERWISSYGTPFPKASSTETIKAAAMQISNGWRRQSSRPDSYGDTSKSNKIKNQIHSKED